MTQTKAAHQRSQNDEFILVQRVRAGETDVFLDLIKPYERSVYLMAYSVLRNEQDAEDAAQEAVFKAFKYLHQFQATGAFRSWLLRIAVNEARLKRRKDRSHIYESIDEGIEESAEGEIMPRQFADWREIPSETLERKEIREHLNKALFDLPEQYREIFLLRDVQQMSEKEAAEVLGITVSAGKVRLHRARLQLREKLTPVFKKRWRDRLSFRKGVKPW